MSHKVIADTLEIISNRHLPDGGVGITADGDFRPDATAWAVLALLSADFNKDLCVKSGSRLTMQQKEDGRIPVIGDCPEAYWPTAQAILAWHQLGMYEKEKDKALQFLLANTGRHWKRKKNSHTKSDPSIEGWPWHENTFSWVVPTADSIIALRACGYTSHTRILEGSRLLIDRQLPAGGWNYGNVAVFGNELKAVPESTGHALCALAGLVDQNTVQKSIDYLTKQITELRTPLSLVWAGFGLSAWGQSPVTYQDQIIDSLAQQRRYGPYDTILLSQLIVAYFTRGRLNRFLSPGAKSTQ